MRRTPPYTRRYIMRLTAAMVAYGAVLVASLHLLRTYDLQGVPLYLTAIAPALPIMAVIWAMGMLVVEMTDEYQRMRMVRSMLVATALCLGALTSLAFLENAGALMVPTFAAFPLWCACMMAVQAFDALFRR